MLSNKFDPFSLEYFSKGRLPNLRKLIVPPLGYTFVDMDLSRADVQVVAWEAEEETLKKALKAEVDTHLFNAANVYQLSIPFDCLKETHPKYPDYIDLYPQQRQNCKLGGHLLNYNGQVPRLAASIGCSLRDAQDFTNRWFSTYPGIKKWHARVKKEIAETRSVRNKFGYRMIFLDRIEDVFNEALAWVPQSTVALTINHAMNNILNNLPEVIVNLQVHDSLDMCVLSHKLKETIPLIRKEAQIVIPYDDPLIIPVGFKYSTKSWGEVKDDKSIG